ncbi:MAG: thioredoxin domain-containing protein [Acidimicrobiales bacterium]
MNRLANETSPYLRQHAGNPVDWYPWGEEALSAARDADKPLFVSIGYASCHWCHVMAHESFEDEGVAALLRASFISIKVDREDRPDLDAIYMAATLAQNGNGGWPMSVFCTPNGRPFFTGTYFPPTDRPGLPCFSKVLNALGNAWATQRAEVERQADQLVTAVSSQVRTVDHLGPAARLPTSFHQSIAELVGQLHRAFDGRWGGFSVAPKFPRPTLIELCLRHHLSTKDPSSLEMATTTLDAMARGGIYDHVAGGFARYSTDGTWMVPHFEKMLTDQALLARCYLHAFQVTANPDYRQVATETFDSMLDEMAAPNGGLCSSIDADADGVEGAHVTFTMDELGEALDAAGLGSQLPEVASFYGVSETGNWESTNVVRRPLGGALDRPQNIEAARRALLDARRARPQPSMDDKVLTEWNAMAATCLAEAAAATGTDRWAEAAIEIATFLFDHLRRDDGRWLRSFQGGRARHLAYAADYAWVVECSTRLAELTGSQIWTRRALETSREMLTLFQEPDGLMSTTGVDAQELVVRPIDTVDGATPSANAVALGALARVANLTGDGMTGAAARKIADSLAPLIAATPLAFADTIANATRLEDPTEILVSGSRPDLLAVVRSHWLPDAVVAWGEPTGSPLWENRDQDLAYLCHSYACRQPTGDPATLEAQINAL